MGHAALVRLLWRHRMRRGLFVWATFFWRSSWYDDLRNLGNKPALLCLKSLGHSRYGHYDHCISKFIVLSDDGSYTARSKAAPVGVGFLCLFGAWCINKGLDGSCDHWSRHFDLGPCHQSMERFMAGILAFGYHSFS